MDKIQSAFLFEQLVDNHLKINVTLRLFVKKANPSDGFAQVRNQVGIPGGAKDFLRGAQIFKLCPIRPVTSLGHQGSCGVLWEGSKIFKLCSIVFNYAQQIFPGGAKRFAGEVSAPFSPGYWPVSNSFKVCPTHFSRGAENCSSSLRAWFFPILVLRR